MSRMPYILFWCCCWLLVPGISGAAPSARDVIPPKPAQYFNDYAGVISPQVAQRLNLELENFERQTSSQVLVVLFRQLPPDAALEDFTIRAAEAWKPGQKDRDNGAILFIFVQDRKMRIETGYGLEGALPDALASRIIAEQIAPHFRQGNWDAGVVAGVNGIFQAIRGEYKGTGSTVGDGRGRSREGFPFGMIVLALFFLIFFSNLRRRATVYHHRRHTHWGGWTGGSWGGGWSGGGSWGGGSGGGFSGGGGRFGGGGASGSW